MLITAPFAGIVHYTVEVGQRVAKGEQLASVEAVKLEAPVCASHAGVVRRLATEQYADVAGGDALLEIDEE